MDQPIIEPRDLRTHVGLSYTSCRLQLLTWYCSDDDPTELCRSTLDSMNQCFALLEDDIPIVFDCRRVESVSAELQIESRYTNSARHCFSQIRERAIESSRDVCFINLDSDEILRDFPHEVFPSQNFDVEHGGTNVAFRPKGSRRSETLQSLLKAASARESIETQYTTEIAGDCFREFPGIGDDRFHRLRSTPVRSTGFFDAQQLIGNPKKFPWIVARCADLVEQVSANVPVRLLSCTRNGTIMSAAIRGLLPDHPPLDVVDQFGPGLHMTEQYIGYSSDDDSPSYIYIGDFVIAGTELKLAEAHAYYNRIPLLGAVVIGSLFPLADRSAPIEDGPGSTVVERIELRRLYDIWDLAKGKLEYRFP